MTKHFRVLALAFLIILMLVPLAVYVQRSTQPKDTAEEDGIGGDFRECLVHSGYYHIGLDPFIGTLVSSEEFLKWASPLRAKEDSARAKMGSVPGDRLINFSAFMAYSGRTYEDFSGWGLPLQAKEDSPGEWLIPLSAFVANFGITEDFSKWYVPLPPAKMNFVPGECLVNLSTFIAHFGITREQIQQLINDTRVDFFLEYNLDILFSGDRALIEAYYAIENEDLHAQMASERRDKYSSEKLMNLQRIVNKNASMSKYYHDIWTFASSMPAGFKSQILVWMQGLVDAGQYDRVNIVEFVHHIEFEFQGLGSFREPFERFATEHNMNLFTHYNLDVIFSGDPRLIKEYYSKGNESRHAAQVRERFEQFVSKYGQPAKNSRVDLDR